MDVLRWSGNLDVAKGLWTAVAPESGEEDNIVYYFEYYFDLKLDVERVW